MNHENVTNRGPLGAPLIFLYKVSIVVLIDFIAILITPGQVEKNIHVREINISVKAPEFVISIQNLSICAVNDEILKNVINICRNS